MSNLRKNNKHNPLLKLNYDDYWDFYINHDEIYNRGSYYNGKYYDDANIVKIDLCNKDCISGNTIMSDERHYWDKGFANNTVLSNISYVGIDNGLFTYRKDRITNKDFISILKKSTYTIHEDDTRLKLHAVSGNTLVYEYPLHINDCEAELNGGFFQGFFKVGCGDYEVFPSKFEDGDVLNFEFTLKKCDLDKESNKTLNDKYPNNKGIFFYIGTRAENKWIYLYDNTENPCETFGIGNFVEDGDIEKKDYIIGNFKNVDPFYEEDEEDDYMYFYTDFNYYDPNLYKEGECDFDDMFDYLDFPKKPKLIDETEEHETIECVCEPNKSVLRPYRNGCGCQLRYRKERASEAKFSSTDSFGDDYLKYSDDISDSQECNIYIEDDIDISDFEYELDNGLPLSDANQYYFYTDNKFLLFDRTCNGMTVDKWVDGTQFMYYGRKSQFKGNLFMLMDRTSTGYNVSNIDELIYKDSNKYNPYNDIYDNALAFRITDDGEIGYRLLTYDCSIEGDNKSKIIEGYSNKGIIPNCEWCSVDVRVTFLGYGKMKFMFYVNGKLVYITKELPRIRLRKLNDIWDKQEGVPFNMSLGGGTQGLCDTVQFNYMLEADRKYPLEENFGGTFIGYIKSFKVYDVPLTKEIVEDNYILNIR